jgi:hypothetical protein
MALAVALTGRPRVEVDGGVFVFGTIPFHGSLSGAHILAPVVGMASTGRGDGYVLLTESGELRARAGVLAGRARRRDH